MHKTALKTNGNYTGPQSTDIIDWLYKRGENFATQLRLCYFKLYIRAVPAEAGFVEVNPATAGARLLVYYH